MIGLEKSGKSTILQRFKLGDNFHAQVPTRDDNEYHFENIEYNSTLMHISDLGGGPQSSKKWKDHVGDADALVYVVDASSFEYVDIAREKLHDLLFSNYAHDLPLLIFANKQDRPCPMETEEIKEELDVDEILPLCKMLKIQMCSATRGKGVNEGFNWLTKIMRLA